MLRTALLFVGILLCTSTALAQDTYHTALLNQLENEAGITGGDWILSSNEAETLERVFTSANVIRQEVAVTGQPFSRALRLTAGFRGKNLWDYFTGAVPNGDLRAGDKALLVFWARGIQAERAFGSLHAKIEKNVPDWDTSLSRSVPLSGEWQQWIIPFEATVNHPRGDFQAIFHMGAMAQTIEMGGLAIINYGTRYALDQLPTSGQELTYPGREAGAGWRVDATARIEQYRKGDLTVQVVDSRGKPVEHANVQVEMKRHHFGFGTAIAIWMMLQQGSNANMYRSKMADLTGDGKRFSYSVIDLKWDTWENQTWPSTQAETIEVIQQLKDWDMEVRGHNLIWPGWGFMPAEAQALQSNPAGLRQLIQNRIADVAGRTGIRGELIDWDVLNEPAHLMDVANVFEQEAGFVTGEEVYAEWFNQVASLDPKAKLYINEFGLINNNGLDLALQDRYLNLIEFIENAGGRIDGIGIQGHMNLPLTPPEVVYEMLDFYAATGKELSITEFDAIGVEEELAAAYLTDLLTVAFSHPFVSSFIIWGFWDGAHWGDDAPLFRQDWSLKPSGQAFFDLVFEEWWTSEVATTDANGEMSVRGFYGDYEIVATFGAEELRQEIAMVPGDGPREIKLYLAQKVNNEQGDISQFELLPHYPDPIADELTLLYVLPEPANVSVEFFDVLGREVHAFPAKMNDVGRQRKILDVSGLPSGLYFYKLKAGNYIATSKFVKR